MVPEIQNYTIVREIGTGGMAVVYEASDDRLQRTVAIKVLHPHLCKEQAAADRFIREARAAAKIDHPNVVRVYDYGSKDDLRYIVMEYVPGTNMERVLRERGNVPPEPAVEIMHQIAEALAQAHALGIIHRDVKPANILLHRQRRAMLTDFGLAHHLPDPRLTTDNAVAGTPSFMSPEQIGGNAVDTATDIYSWGVCLYMLVAGELPYTAQRFPEVIGKIRVGDIHLDSGLLKVLPPFYYDLLHRCLAADPRKRIHDANELLGQLSLSGIRKTGGIDTDFLKDDTGREPGQEDQSPAATVVIPRKKNNGFRYVPAALLAFAAAALFFWALFVVRIPIGTIKSPSGKNAEPFVFKLTQPDTMAGAQAVPDTSQRTTDGEDVNSTGAEKLLFTSHKTQVSAVAGSPSGGAAGPAVDKKQQDSGAGGSPVGTTGDTSAQAAPSDSGGLFIYCHPWAVVRVGDREIGTTPFAGPVRLPAGDHVVTLGNGFCEPLTDTVTVAAGRVVRKRYTLKVKEQ
jgi:serine/threonine protein kinase